MGGKNKPRTNGSSSSSQRVSIFKQVFSRHKRKGKDPNRIDDLLLGQNSNGNNNSNNNNNNNNNHHSTTTSLEPNAEGVIDVVRIGRFHAHKRRKRKRAESLLSNNATIATATTTATATTSIAANCCFGHDLVVPVESKLCFSDGNAGCCRCGGYAFCEFPGVYLYPGVLDRDLQRELAYRAVTEYCERSVLPSDNHNDNDNDNDNDNRNEENENTSAPDQSQSHRTNIDLLPPKPNERVNRIGVVDEYMWTLWKREHQRSKTAGGPAEKNSSSKANNNNNNNNNPNNNNFYRRFSKLSWATMGYHYDWTERSYHPQKKSIVPELVARLSTLFATARPSCCGAEHDGSLHHQTEEEIGSSPSGATPPPPPPIGAEHPLVPSFTPSASIVNYYTTKSTMGGHRDDLEDPGAMDKPIVSVSLGLPGIFILGGPDKEEYADEHRHDDDDEERDDNHPPSGNPPADIAPRPHPHPHPRTRPHPVRAILLRPGDVLIMGGPSRLNYHAMARVVPHEAALAYERSTSTSTSTTVLLPSGGENNAQQQQQQQQTSGEASGEPTLGPPHSSSSSISSSGVAGGVVALRDLVVPDATTDDAAFADAFANAERLPAPPLRNQQEEEDGEFLNEYLRHHRININVRQVYPDT